MTTRAGWRNGKRAGAEQEGTPGFSQGGPLLPYRRSCERRTYAVGKEQDASGVISTVRGPRSGIRAVVGSGGPPACAVNRSSRRGSRLTRACGEREEVV